MKLRCGLYLSVLLFVGILSPEDLFADTLGKKRILVVSDEQEQASMASLTVLLNAHLEDLGAWVTLEVIDSSPRDIFEQVSSARELVRSRGAFSAIWVERSKEEVFLFVSDNSEQNVFLQTFEGSEDGWEVECEAIAALVRSALITWLAVAPDPFSDPASVAEEENSDAASPSSKPAESSTTKGGAEVEASAHPDKKRESTRLTAGVGYAPRLIDLNKPVTHSADIALGARFLGKVSLETSVRVGSFLDLDVEGMQLSFRHFPLYISAGWIFRLNIVEIGLGAALVLDFIYLKSNLPPYRPDGQKRVNPGLGARGRVGIRPFNNLSFFAEVGGDIFFKTYTYKWEDTDLLTYSAVQPYFLVGVMLISGKAR